MNAEEEIERLHRKLDELGAPRTAEGFVYTAFGRLDAYIESFKRNETNFQKASRLEKELRAINRLKLESKFLSEAWSYYNKEASKKSEQVKDAWREWESEKHQMLDRPTPETDANSGDDWTPGVELVRADFARLLERQRDDALSKLDSMREARMLGRQEALKIIVETDPDGFCDDCIGSHAIGDTGDYSSHWEVEKLAKLLDANEVSSLIERLDSSCFDLFVKANQLEMDIEKLKAISEKSK